MTYFYFSMLTLLLHSLLACSVSGEKSFDSLEGVVCLYERIFFLLWLFKFFFVLYFIIIHLMDECFGLKF